MTCRKDPLTKGEAIRRIQRMQGNARLTVVPFRYHWCRKHQAYHVTSKPKKKNSED